jgi:hypothetical protein
MLSAEMARHDMVYGQAAVTFAAVLAGIIIPAKDLTAGQLDVGARSMNLGFQSNDRGTRQQLLHRPDVSTPVHHHVSLASQEQADCPARGTNIDRFKIRIENQHGFVHYSASTTGRIILPIVRIRKLV